ncbi:alpha-L-rhamnosidase [Pseudonocardia kunmingensis]|uniref:alpha-L-rhamnosidase n=1 Tax=Pseudonocardia kunmingensis TaxID=630975 RepID=A0A543DRS3_9PSEU|nr:alpha-L-rhamnosidase [Pseudonocardia kunmingensis]TQM11999.1 alpha-L-rhamnosidase [Pseudonocardia kunmingensis]
MPIRVARVTAEYATDRATVATPRPRLSWVTESDGADWRQAAAEVQLQTGGEGRSVRLDGPESVLVDWPFEALEPGAEHEVRVRVTGADGETSEWSAPQPVVAGFLAEGGWTARMVGLADPAAEAQPALVRAAFTVDGPLRRATLYATAHGVYQVELNGREVDDEVLKPGWTTYQQRLLHETTDVTALLAEGENALGVWLSGGWFCERFGFRDSAARFYGTQPAVAVQLVLDYADGRTETVASGPDWRATGEGPVTAGGIYAGESYDATRVLPGWSAPGFDDSGWSPVRVDGEFPVPEARMSPGARRTEDVAVREVLTTPSGATVLDFGQNLVGRLRITVRGERGSTVTLRHAEVLEGGELCTRPLRAAEAVDRYTLAGGGAETWEPRSTFHGFRYVQVEGWPGELDPADVVAVVVHTDMRRTGWFECSHALVNRLHENVVWGMRGNFLHVPTDCPQRDERLGWTGDIQVFAPTASLLFDCDGFLASWLRDLALEQRAHDGVVPFIVPDVLEKARTPAAAWGDAATVVPLVLHERFGDRAVVAAQYDSMRDWVEVLLRLSGPRLLWEGGFQFGDWLDPAAPPERPGDATTDQDLVASAHLFRSTDLLACAAALLGREQDAAHYRDVAERVRAAFLREYVTPAGRMLSDTQTAYAMALVYGIVSDPDLRQVMGDRLAALVRTAGYRVATGFVGTPIVQDALTEAGHTGAAARLLLQTDCPSWLYPVTMGATTVWERWDSLLEDGSVNPGQMTSFNHYAFGAIADWLHRVVAGLAPAAPGYAEIAIAPHPLPGLDFARTAHETPYGRASAGWERRNDQSRGDRIVVDAVVPPNTTATVRLPGAAQVLTVGSGTHRWEVAAPAASNGHGTVGLETPLAEVIDDPEAYEALVTTLRSHDAAQARDFRDRTRWLPNRPLSDALDRVSPHVKEGVRAALESVSSGRTR